MAKLLQTLIPILLLAAAATTARSEVPPSSTSFFYDFHPLAPRTGLTFQGDMQVAPLGASYIRLTGPTNHTFSRVLYTDPVQLWQTGGQADFETTFSFQISTLPGVSPADGLVFFIAPAGTQPPNGATGGNFGVFHASGNGPAVFAVEFDTYVDDWDPNYRHIGIDFGSVNSAVTKDVGNAIVGKKVTARISYAAATKTISVLVKSGEETFELSYEYDLSHFLPQQVQVGLAASTGEAYSVHDVTYWYFTSKMVDTGAAPATAAKSGRKQLIRQFV